MRDFKLLSGLIVAVLLGVGCSKEDSLPSAAENNSSVQRNGAPSGAHYNLNIIGKSNPTTADLANSNGHRIFVPLVGRSKIMLIEGPDYAVIDANGSDGSASFQLPHPDPEGTGSSSYSIYARALGTPGGSVTITTCADADLTDGYYEVCSAEPLTISRSKNGAPKFTNVSTELLTILVPNDILNTDGTVLLESGRYPIFDDALENYFWQYDNDGLKLLQLRFYEISTDITP